MPTSIWSSPKTLRDLVRYATSKPVLLVDFQGRPQGPYDIFYHIIAKISSGQEITFLVDSHTTIRKVKAGIQRKEGISFNERMLIEYAGKLLEDGRTLSGELSVVLRRETWEGLTTPYQTTTFGKAVYCMSCSNSTEVVSILIPSYPKISFFSFRWPSSGRRSNGSRSWRQDCSEDL